MPRKLNIPDEKFLELFNQGLKESAVSEALGISKNAAWKHRVRLAEEINIPYRLKEKSQKRRESLFSPYLDQVMQMLSWGFSPQRINNVLTIDNGEIGSTNALKCYIYRNIEVAS